MSAKPIELILLRQLASRLPMPASLVDAQGMVVYFNPPTERMLGFEHSVMGEVPMSHIRDLIDARYPDRSPMPVEQMPPAVALHDRCPQQAKMIIHGSDGVPHPIVTTTIPLDGQGGVLLGAMSIFWEDEEGG